MKKLNILNYLFVILASTGLGGQISSIEISGTKSNNLGSITNGFTDINAAYTNQAGIAFLKTTCINISYENRFLTDLNTMGFAIARPFKKQGAFGLTIKKFGIQEFNEIQVGGSYARKINKDIAIGLQINFFNLSIEGYGNKSSASFETGVLYNISKKLIVGCHIKNPFPIKFLESVELPTVISLGLKYKISSILNIYAEVEKNIQKTTLIKSGMEYSPLKSFSLSLGMRYDLEQYANYSFGIAYSIKEKIKIELGTIYDLTLGLSPNISVNYIF